MKLNFAYSGTPIRGQEFGDKILNATGGFIGLSFLSPAKKYPVPEFAEFMDYDEDSHFLRSSKDEMPCDGFPISRARSRKD